MNRLLFIAALAGAGLIFWAGHSWAGNTYDRQTTKQILYHQKLLDKICEGKMKDYIKGRWRVVACDAGNLVAMDLAVPERAQKLSVDQLKDEHNRVYELCSMTEDKHWCYAMNLFSDELNNRGWCSQNPDLYYWYRCKEGEGKLNDGGNRD
jgi:hypothetical protein